MIYNRILDYKQIYDRYNLTYNIIMFIFEIGL